MVHAAPTPTTLRSAPWVTGTATYTITRTVTVNVWSGDVAAARVTLNPGDTVTGRPRVSFAVPGRINVLLDRKSHVILPADAVEREA